MMRVGMRQETELGCTKSEERIMDAEKKKVFCVCVLIFFVTLQPNSQDHKDGVLYYKRVVTNIDNYGRLSGE
jgi:hypothetical protein